jgi:benzil reductase ((S)-benzoin forming)
MSVLITGHSSGLGRALAENYLKKGKQVWGIARRTLDRSDLDLVEIEADLSDMAALKSTLNDAQDILAGKPQTVFLNAAALGPIGPMSKITQQEIQTVMNTNVWGNKVILDWLIEKKIAPKQIILLSSGAAISANYGWGPYALSKSSLNMLGKLYSQEMINTHIISLAPGYVDTPMQEKLRAVDANSFPSVKPLHEAQGTTLMPSAEDAAREIIRHLDGLRKYPTGTFVDLRNITQ